MKTLRAFAALVLCLASFAPGGAWGYVLSTNTSGAVIKWPTPTPTFSANWNNASSLSYSQVFTAFTTSLQRWKYLGSASIDFDYVQSANSPSSWGSDGINAVFFSSQAPAGQKLGGTTIGVTYVFSSGTNIVETDVEFNDEAFVFSTNPTESSQFSGNRIYLENVATHEFGHAYGLNHSGVLQSTMVYLEDRGQAKPSCDDIEAIAAQYPAASFTAGRGSITGVIQFGGANVYGAHVLAVSKTRGTVVVGALTQCNGSYTIPNLEPGDYYLVVEPFETTAPGSALVGGNPLNCAGVFNSNTVCPAATPFKRSVIEAGPGVPQTVTVTNGGVNNVGTYTVTCIAMSDPWVGQNTASGTAPVLIANNGGATATGTIRGIAGAAGSAQYYKLNNVTGSIKATAVAYNLYSRIDPSVTILDNSGTTVAAGVSAVDNTFSDSSNFVNYDSTASLTTSGPANTYYVKVINGGDLYPTPAQYPAGSVGYGGANPQIDLNPFYLLIVTINDNTILLPSTASPTMANNARCEAADSFGPFPDHGPGASSSSSAGSGSSAGAKGAGACGSIHDDGSGPDANALFSAWGILCMLLMGRSLQRLARRYFAR